MLLLCLVHKNCLQRVPIVAQRKWIWLVTMRFHVRSLASLSGLRIRCCWELWCRSKTRLGSCIAVALCRPAAVASIWLLAWEPPYAAGAALKSKSKTKQNKTKQNCLQYFPSLLYLHLPSGCRRSGAPFQVPWSQQTEGRSLEWPENFRKQNSSPSHSCPVLDHDTMRKQPLDVLTHWDLWVGFTDISVTYHH